MVDMCAALQTAVGTSWMALANGFNNNGGRVWVDNLLVARQYIGPVKKQSEWPISSGRCFPRRRITMHKVRGWLYGLAVLCATSAPVAAQHEPSQNPPARDSSANTSPTTTRNSAARPAAWIRTRWSRG